MSMARPQGCRRGGLGLGCLNAAVNNILRQRDDAQLDLAIAKPQCPVRKGPGLLAGAR